MRNFLKVFTQPSQKAKDGVIAIGFVSKILAASKKHRALSAGAYLSDVIVPALRYGRVFLFFDERGDPVGFLVWMTLAPETERKLLNSGVLSFHKSEFSETGRLWLIDFAAPYGHAPFILENTFTSLQSSHDSFRYLRRTHSRFWVREVEIQRALTILRRRTLVDED